MRGVTSCPWAADKHPVSTDAQTQAIPRVPVADAAVARIVPALGGDAKVAAAEGAAETASSAPDADVTVPEPDAEVACEVSVEDIYEAGLSKLEALHGHWSAAMAEFRQVPARGDLGKAAA